MHIPRKRFGQHFLHDKQVIQHIVDVIQPDANQHLVEIGPGYGALTLPILKKSGYIDAVELDWDLVPLLKNRCENKGTLNIHRADALSFDFSTLYTRSKQLRLIGNLPYNISTPLIFHLLTFSNCIQDMHFMLQKEVVDRMAATPGNHVYGRLSIMVQYHCEVIPLFDVPPDAFDPPPKVFSSIVKLVPYHNLPFVAKNYVHFSNLVREAFCHRRKTLRNSLKTYVDDASWQKTAIDPQRRPEELTVEEYVFLSNLTQG